MLKTASSHSETLYEHTLTGGALRKLLTSFVTSPSTKHTSDEIYRDDDCENESHMLSPSNIRFVFSQHWSCTLDVER